MAPSGDARTAGWPCLRTSAAGVVLELAIQPRAGTTGVVGLHDGALKLRLTAPPVEGAANRACLEFLAALFGMPKSRVTLIKGEKSRRKSVLLEGLGLTEAERIIERIIRGG